MRLKPKIKKFAPGLPAINVQRSDIRLVPDQNRVVLRPLKFETHDEYLKITKRVLALSEGKVRNVLDQVLEDFSSRHRLLKDRFLSRFQQVEHYLAADGAISEARKLLIGSYFFFEYSAESAGLFNPSILAHPDQSGIAPESLRFLLSLRSVGESHISSIAFRSGVINAGFSITMKPTSRYLCEPTVIENPIYRKAIFERKIAEMGLSGKWTKNMMRGLGNTFTLAELKKCLMGAIKKTSPGKRFEDDPVSSGVWLLAQCNYEISFGPDQELSERIIFPVTSIQSNGIEDVRLVAHEDENEKLTYFATYTAYDGRNVLPQLFTTQDFRNFKFTTLNGPGVQNKGMALFPKKIKGRYAMLSRQDGENIYLMYSDNVHFWYRAQRIVEPVYPWEFVKTGNCGSPIETKEGWLVLSHGVGPLRQYCLGAFLLDRENPTKVIGRLGEPLMRPQGDEREGYVPNVLYTCGALVHAGRLILPYGMSDRVTGFAVISVDNILAAMA